MNVGDALVSTVLDRNFYLSGFYSVFHVQIEDHTIVLTALSYYQQGLDFIDSLHAARSQAMTL